MSNQVKKDASPQELAKQLMPDAALQTAMRDQVGNVGNCRIYAVADAWQRKELQQMAMLRRAENASGFEALARDWQTKAIYVPESSGLSLALVSELLRRTGADLPVFMEKP